MIAQYGLGFGAGLLSLLAPCVLPLIPIVFGSSMQSSKYGPLANAMGLTLSFTLIGILTSLFSSLFDVDFIQKLGAFILIIVGIVFLVPKLKDLLTEKLSKIGNTGHQLQSKIKSQGWLKEFLMGSVLGMVWAPCSGPTLAFAFGIATQSDKIIHASLIFFFFGLGAGIGLILLGLTLKRFKSLTGKIMGQSKTINFIMGLSSLFIGIFIMTGQIGLIEEAILNIMPDFLIKLSTSI